jgi:hypothetical protein
MEGARTHGLLKRKAITSLRVPQGKRTNGKIVLLPQHTGLIDFFDDDLIIYVHIERSSALLDIFSDFWRAKNVERLVAVHLAIQH